MSVSTLEREELKAARDRGVAYLNENWPEWKSKVNKDDLDMNMWDKCILAQVTGTGHYDVAIEECIEEDDEWAEERGFYVSGRPEAYVPKYIVLTELWKEILIDG